MKVAAIGLDAGELPYIESLMAAGQMPHLSKIAERSVRCRLTSNEAWRYGLVWQQFLYGQEVDLSDSWNGMGFDARNYRMWQRNAGFYASRHPFWTDPSLDCIAFDVPWLTRGEHDSGVQVVSWGAEAAQHVRASQPAGLLREIDDRFGSHPAFGNDYEVTWHDHERMDILVEALDVGSHRRLEIASWLLERFPDSELLVTVMSELHSANEYLWHGVDPDHPLATTEGAWSAERLVRVHADLDDAIGRFAASLSPDWALVVFSVYGSATSPGDTPSIALLPELLQRISGGPAYLTSPDREAWAAAGHPPVIPEPGQSWEDAMDVSWVGPPPPRSPYPAAGRRLAKAIGRPSTTIRSLRSRLQPQMMGALGVPIPAETYLTRADIRRQPGDALEWQFGARYRRRWPEMRAFALPTFSDGLIRVNLQGRERNGVVAQDSFEAVLDELDAVLRACRNPRTGGPAVAEVARFNPDVRAALAQDAAPADLAVRWAGPLDAIEHVDAGVIGPYPLHRTGTHSPRGFAMVMAPGLMPCDVGDHLAVDLPPTILDLLGRRPAPWVDGQSFLAGVALSSR